MCLDTWGKFTDFLIFLSLPECVPGIKLCCRGKSRQRELETKDCQKDRQVLVTQKRHEKLQSRMADVSTCIWWWGEKAGEMVGGGPALVPRPQLGGGGWFRVSRRRAEEG